VARTSKAADRAVAVAGGDSQKQVALIKKHLGDCTHNTLKAEAKDYIISAGRSHVEAGLRLKVLKEEMEHGEFKRFAETELPCSYEHALNLVGLVDRLLLLEDKSGGAWSFEATRQIDMKKVFAITRVLDEVEEELGEDGTVDGLTLEDVKLLPRKELEKRTNELKAKLEKAQDNIKKGTEQLRKKEAELQSYQLSDDDAIARMCERVQKGQVASLNEFRHTLEKHIPSGRKLTADERTHLIATVEYLHQIHTSINEIIFTRFPEVETAPATEKVFAKQFVAYAGGAAPSIEKHPANIIDAIQTDLTEEEPAAKSRNGKKAR